MATVTYNSNTTVSGTNNADLLLGTDTAGNNNDVVYGLAGDDTITSTHVAPFALNNSTLYGGQGDDVISGQNSNVIYGNQGDDTLFVHGDTFDGIYANNNTIYGGQGNDSIIIYGPGNDNVAYGGAEDNFIYADDQLQSTLDGGLGNDTINAEFSTALTIYGSDPASSIYGNDSINLFETDASTVYGGQGDDRISSTNDTGNTFYGGGGNDFFLIDNSSADVLYGNQGRDFLDVFDASALTAYGGQGNDTVFETDGAHGVLYGNKGDDFVEDFEGVGFFNAFLKGSGAAEGNSILYGGQGNDTLSAVGAGGDTMFGGEGDNLFAVNSGLAPGTFNVNDLVTVADFVSGNDSLSMSNSISGPGHFTQESDLSADNASDALSFADDFYLSHSSAPNYLFIYGGSGAGYLFYNGIGSGRPDTSASAPTSGMILEGDNAESSVSATDIDNSFFTLF